MSIRAPDYRFVVWFDQRHAPDRAVSAAGAARGGRSDVYQHWWSYLAIVRRGEARRCHANVRQTPGEASGICRSSGSRQDHPIDDRRVGLAIRAIRRNRGWRQVDLARVAGLAQTSISAIERGHLDRASLAHMRHLFGALDGRVEFELRWRGGNLDRTLDERHARLAGVVVERLAPDCWESQVEVTYAIYGERGSIDVLAFHRATGSLLVIEVKTELTSIEETLRRHDEKVRLAPQVARERFGWRAAATSRLLVLPELSTARRQVSQHAAVLDAVLPASGGSVRRWLRSPVGMLRGRWFLPLSPRAAHGRESGGPHRVRLRRRPQG